MDTLIIAHRGFLNPENSLKSIENAYKCGSDGVEFDVHVTKDNHVVLFHDYNFKKFGEKKKQLNRVSIDETRAYDLGDGEKIPLLDDVLEKYSDKLLLNIEVKAKEKTDVIIDVIKKKANIDNVIISSFHFHVLKTFRKRMPEIRLGYLYDLPQFFLDSKLKKINAYSVNPFWIYVTGRYIRKWQSKGYKVFPWTVNNMKRARKYITNGVAAIITDKASELVSLKKTLN